MGIDVGGDRSATAVAWLKQHYQVGVWIGDGDAAVLDARDVIPELAGNYTVREVMFDPWLAGSSPGSSCAGGEHDRASLTPRLATRQAHGRRPERQRHCPLHGTRSAENLPAPVRLLGWL